MKLQCALSSLKGPVISVYLNLYCQEFWAGSLAHAVTWRIVLWSSIGDIFMAAWVSEKFVVSQGSMCVPRGSPTGSQVIITGFWQGLNWCLHRQIIQLSKWLLWSHWSLARVRCRNKQSRVESCVRLFLSNLFMPSKAQPKWRLPWMKEKFGNLPLGPEKKSLFCVSFVMESYHKAFEAVIFDLFFVLLWNKSHLSSLTKECLACYVHIHMHIFECLQSSLTQC